MLDKYINFASKQPKNIQIKNLESLYNNKNFFELIKYSEVFLNKFPESKFIYNLIGVAYFNLGKYSSAIENYNISISLNPKNSEAYNNKGLCLKKMGDFEGNGFFFPSQTIINSRAGGCPEKKHLFSSIEQ